MATVKRIKPDKGPLKQFAPTIRGGLADDRSDQKQDNDTDQDKKPGSFDPLYIVIPGALIGIAIAVYIYGNS